MRIALGGFHHETNTFAPVPADYEAFTRPGGRPALCCGAALLPAMQGYSLPAAGFIDRAQAAGHTILPMVWAEATPSAAVTRDAYERIAGMLIDDLRAAGRVDLVYLCLHGAMVAEDHDDGEGELLRRVRAVVGPDMPVLVSLDFHANVSEALVAQADALVGYRTYPHVDRYQTGERAAALLPLFDGKRPRMHRAMRRLPFLVPLHWQCTLAEPMKALMEQAEALEKPGAEAVELLAGFPLADSPEAGVTVVAYGTDASAVEAAADALERSVLEAEPAFAADLWSPERAIAHIRPRLAATKRPFVLADTQDNPGAGGTADSMGLIRALAASDVEGAVVGVIADEEVAAAAHRAGVGATIHAGLGAKSGFPGEVPLVGDYVVERLGDGAFTATGPFYRGNRMQLGPMALLRLGKVRIVVASRKQQAGDKEMFRHVGIEPAEQKILGLKSSVHFRADFGDIAEEVLIVEAPGPNTADPLKLDYRRLRPGIRLFPQGPAFAG